MRVLFVDEKSWTKKVPYTAHYLAENLVRRGHEVFAVDFDDTWSRDHTGDWIAPRQQRPYAKLDPDCPVNLISPAFIKMPGLSRLSTLATHSVEIDRLLQHQPMDCIVTYAITNAMQSLLLGHRHRVPVAFHSIDMLGPLAPSPLLAKPIEAIERLLIQYSDCVLALTPALGQRAQRLGARRVAIIPNGVNTERLRPGLDCEQLRAELGLASEKVILFVGTLTRHVGLDQFLRHYRDMPRDGVRFVVVGDDIVTKGLELQRAKALCRELDLEGSVLFTGLQPPERVPLFINLADVCLSPFPPSKFSKYNIAMKVFEYMACGKPTVSFHLEGTESLVPDGEGGVVYVETYEEMTAALHKLLHDEPERARLGSMGRDLAEARFSWDSVVRDLEQVLLSLRPAAAPQAA